MTTKTYDDEFLFLCDFLAERLGFTKAHVQINVACVGLAMARRIFRDLSIDSSSDGIEWTGSVPFGQEETWLEMRLEIAWKMIMRISQEIRERGRRNEEGGL